MVNLKKNIHKKKYVGPFFVSTMNYRKSGENIKIK